MLAVLTVGMLAVCTTAGGLLVWWYATQSSEPVPSLQGVDSRVFLGVYVLLMVCPWWALLAVLFGKINWLTPRQARSTDKSTDKSAGVTSSPCLFGGAVADSENSA